MVAFPGNLGRQTASFRTEMIQLCESMRLLVPTGDAGPERMVNGNRGEIDSLH